MGAARRLLALGLVAACACTARRPPDPLPIPAAAPGTVEIRARTLSPPGDDVTVIEVALTSEQADTLVLDRKQIYARTPSTAGAPAQRIAPLGSAEAARRAGSEGLPGAARASAYGAAEGGVRGAATGAVTGGGTGGMVGAAVGAIGGVFRGMQDQPPDVAGFEERALPATTLRAGISATGLLYFPPGDYRELEVVLVSEEEVVRMIVPVAPAPAEE